MREPDIICTLGTTTDDPKVLEEMVKHGMVCARMNTAYACIEDYQVRLDLLKSVTDIPMMMDLKGPQVRLEAQQPIPIQRGDIVYVGFDDEPFHFTKDFYNDVDEGDLVLFENGTITTTVAKKRLHTLHLMVDEPGEGQLHKKMGVNVPGKYLNVARLSDKDVEVIDFSLQNQVEYLALSFVRNYGDVKNLYDTVNQRRRMLGVEHSPAYIAKIEDKYGVSNSKKIIKKAQRDGIPLEVMIARGDMFVELPYHLMPVCQRYLTKLCKKNGVYVITATGILASMQYNAQPSRAELNDLDTILRQGPSAIMFSGETSNGVDPVRVVKTADEYIQGFYERLRRQE
jgi:pyruvate kinase